MMTTRILNVLLVLGLFVPGLAMAQYGSPDQGQYAILSAQYGTSARHVDVTNRLRELARSDRTFRMGNSTFGVDPAPGERKVLHIFARGPNGQERISNTPKEARSMAPSSEVGDEAIGDKVDGAATGRAKTKATTKAKTKGMSGSPRWKPPSETCARPNRTCRAPSRTREATGKRLWNISTGLSQKRKAGIQYANAH